YLHAGAIEHSVAGGILDRRLRGWFHFVESRQGLVGLLASFRLFLLFAFCGGGKRTRQQQRNQYEFLHRTTPSLLGTRTPSGPRLTSQKLAECGAEEPCQKFQCGGVIRARGRTRGTAQENTNLYGEAIAIAAHQSAEPFKLDSVQLMAGMCETD